MQCIIDCRIDAKQQNNFLELSIWGKPCYMHVVNAVEEAGCFSHITLVSQSDKIIENCDRDSVEIMRKFPWIEDDTFIISGRAPCISAATIKRAVSEFDGRQMISSRKESGYHFDNDTISSYAGMRDKLFNAFRISEGGGGGGKK